MATRATKRPLNKCGSCGHTWYPKGRALSVRCPECRSTDTKKAGAGVGAVALFLAALTVFGGKKESHPTPDTQITGVSETQVVERATPASAPEPTLNDANLSGAAVSGASDVEPVVNSAQMGLSTSRAESRIDTPVSSPAPAAVPDGASDVKPHAESGPATVPMLPPVRDREHH